MGTIAEKLEHLDGTREKILTETNRLGVGLTEQDKFRDYAKGLHDGYVDVLNNGIDTLYDNMEKVSGSGSDITLENTEEAPMRSDLEGDTYQETTTGKNLCKPIATATKNGMTFTNNNDGSYTLNGTASANTSFYITGLNYPTGTYTISCNNPVANSSGAFYIQAEYSGGSIRIPFTNVNTVITGTTTNPITAWSIVVPSGLTLTNFVIKPQLEVGETATSFEEYTGGQPSPSPDYPQEVQVVSGRQEVDVVGKNLLNITATSQTKNNIEFTINEDKTVLVNGKGNSSSYLVLGEVYLTENKTYILSGCPTGGGSGKYALSIYDSDNIRVADDFGSGKTYTPTNSGTYKIGIQYWYNWTISNLTFKPQLEKGSTASEYEAFKGQSYEINLGKNLYDPSYRRTDNTIYAVNCSVVENNGTFTLTATDTDMYMWQIRPAGQTYDKDLQGQLFNFDSNAYTINISNHTMMANYITYFDENKVSLGFASFGGVGYTKTIKKSDVPSGTKYFSIRIGYNHAEVGEEYSFTVQVEKGSEATSYSSYKTPIELCKIGTYQDKIYKENGTWYLHKEIGKVVLDGSESWTEFNSVSGSSGTLSQIGRVMTFKTREGISNNFTVIPNYTPTEHIVIGGGLNRLYVQIANSRLSSVDIAGFKTWLSTHNTSLYYILATPTTTEITDSELISQLEEWYNAKSNKDVTYISVTSEDLPAILNVIAIKKYE